MKKRCVAILLIVIAVLICSCNSLENERTDTSTNADIKSEENIISYQVCHADMDYLYDKAFVQDDYVYGFNYSNPDTILVESISDTDDNQSVKITDSEEIYGIWKDKNGYIFVCGIDKDEVFSLWRIGINSDCEKISEYKDVNIGLYPKYCGYYYDKQYNYIWFKSSVLCAEVYDDGEEDVYTLTDRVLIWDNDMQYLGYDEVPDSYGNHLFGIYNNDNSVLFLARDDEGCYGKEISTDLVEKERIGISLDLYDIVLPMLWTDEGLLYIENGDIYLLDYNLGIGTCIYHLSNSGIYEKDIISWDIYNDSIRIVDTNNSSGETEITVLKENGDYQTEMIEEKVITIAIMNSQQSISEAVTAYNRFQNDVQVKTVVYAPDWDVEKGLQQLHLDILQNKAPDLISTNSLDYETLINIGVFDNLYEYMDQDEDLNRDDIVPSVLKAYENGEELYVMGPSFTVFTMWGGKSIINGQKCLGITEIESLLSSKGGNINSIYGLSSADETALRSLMAMEMDDYIDWDNNTCNFNSEGFKDILKIAREYDGLGTDKSLYNSISNKEILMTYGMVSAVQGYSLESELYGEPIEYIGYPTTSGYGSAMQMYSPVAINSNSNNKEEAWDFLKYYIKHEYGDVYDFSVCQEKLEQQFEEAMNEKYEKDETGELVKVPKASYDEADYCVEIYSSSREDVDAVRELINNTTKKREYVLEIQKIIEEEAGAYMIGQKTSDEVAAIIQSRVEIYLQERND